MGTSHCGKSYLRKEFEKIPDVVIWDIQTWYKKNEIIVGNEMNWDAFKEKGHLSWEDFFRFIQKTSADIIILETSGINQLFNKKLEEFVMPVIKIPLIIPPDNILKERAIERGELPYQKVLLWAQTYLYKTEIQQEDEFTIEEAGLYIQEIIKYVRIKNGK
jgi:hypothetical protein